MIQYLSISIIAFLGLFCGLFVGMAAEEELKPGRRYFEWLRHGLFILILGLFFILNPSWVFILVVAAVVLAMSFSRYREILYYYALAPVMYLSFIYNGFLYIAPLVFLYGFPLGSMYRLENIKKKWKQNAKGLLVRYSGFLVLSICFSVIQLFI